MKKFITAVLTVMIIFISNSVSAHKATGYKPDRTLETVKTVERYMQEHYQLTLSKEIWIHVADTTAKFYNVLVQEKIPDAKYYATSANAVTSRENGILINNEGMTDEYFNFVLAHEMVHKYQLEHVWLPYGDWVQLEGQADLLGSKISGHPISIADHKIPYKKLKLKQHFDEESRKRPKDVLEQIRYYASKTDFEKTLLRTVLKKKKR